MTQATLDQPLVISWTTDASGGCTHIDPLWRAFTGQDESQAQGFGWLEAVHPDDRDETRALFTRVSETRAPYRREYRLRRAEGDYRWTLSAGAPRFEANGDFAGYVGSVVDIDEKRAAEARLAESEELHRKLLGALADGVFVAQDHRFVFANPTLPALLGFQHDEFEGLPFDAVIAPEDLKVWTARYEARIADGPEPPQHYKLRVLRREGEALDMELSARRIRYKGRPAVLGVLRDVTERHRAEEALRKSEEQLAADLAGMRRLHALHAKLANETDLRAALDEILAAAVTFAGTTRGTVDLVDERTGALEIVAHRGYAPGDRFIADARDPGLKRPCETARRERRRLIVENVAALAASGRIEGCEVALASGVGALLSAPMITRKGDLVGMLGVQFPGPYRPGDHELRLMDLLAWTAAEFVERRRTDAALRASEERQAFLLRLSDALRARSAPADIESAALRLLGEQLCADRAFYAVFEEPGEIVIHHDYARAGSTSLAGRYAIEDFASAIDAMRPDVPFVCNDVSGSESLSPQERARFETLSIGALMSQTLVDNGAARAAIGVTESSARKWTSGEIALMQGAVERTSAAIERARAEAALRESEKRFRSLVTATSEVVYGMSPDWSQLLYLWGRSFLPDVIEPKSDWLDAYILPEDRPLIMAAVAEAVRNGRVFEVEHRLRLADGAIRWVFSRAIPHFGENGQIVEWFGAVSDVTDRKNGEESLKEAHRLKDEFLATLAHELRNPLAPIRNGVTLLSNGAVDPEKSRLVLEMMDRQVQHLIRLVDDLLEIARISQGKIALRKEAANLPAILRASLETSQPVIEKGRHQVSMRAPSQLRVMGDPIRLGQAFTNLLNNAAKFTPPGGRIEIIGETEGNHAIVRVRDNGCGISPAALPRVFDMFAQVEDKARHAQGGLGIGLALVRKLIDMHGGTVQAQSDGPDKGSEFTVRLPLLEAGATTGATEKPAPAPAVVPPMAVVIDDNRDAADALAMLLESFGAQARVAYDGVAGCQLVQAVRPGVVFLDLGMPKQDGFETARLIRETAIGRKLTLVALTGWGQEEDRNRTRQAGFDAHLTKPAALDALQALLASAGQGPANSDARALDDPAREPSRAEP